MHKNESAGNESKNGRIGYVASATRSLRRRIEDRILKRRFREYSRSVYLADTEIARAFSPSEYAARISRYAVHELSDQMIKDGLVVFEQRRNQTGAGTLLNVKVKVLI